MMSKKRITNKIAKNRITFEYLLMVLPGFLLTLIFAYIPMVGILVAFKNIDYSKGILFSPWCGMANFKLLFASPDLKIILRNTIGYNLSFVVLNAVIPLTLSIALSQLRNKRTSKVYQTIIMLPHFISYIIVTYIVYAFLSYKLGTVNNLLQRFGVEPTDWYSNVKVWPYIILFLGVWKVTGYNSVVYLAAITGIDDTLYEAAAIDGAKKYQQIWYVTLPQLANVVIIMVILNLGAILNSDIGLFLNVPMEKGQLFPVTNVISTYTYRALRINGDVGMSSAAGFFQSVVGFIIVLITNSCVKKIDSEKALF